MTDLTDKTAEEINDAWQRLKLEHSTSTHNYFKPMPKTFKEKAWGAFTTAAAWAIVLAVVILALPVAGFIAKVIWKAVTWGWSWW